MFPVPMFLRDRWCWFDAAYGRREQQVVGAFRRYVLTDLPWAIVVVAVARLLCLITYPPNLSGDAIGYLYMTRKWFSNLILPGGSPCLVGGLGYFLLLMIAITFVRHLNKLRFRHWGLLAIAAVPIVGFSQFSAVDGSPVHKTYVLYQQYWFAFVQHLIVVAVLLFVHRTVSALWNRTAASLSVLIYGLHPASLAWTSSFYASWLQGLALAVTLCLLYWAFVSELPRQKTLRYSLAGCAFAWCFLIKPNALPFILAFPVVLFFDSLRWRQRAKMLIAASGCAVATCLWYTLYFHYPSTGTTALTHDKAWVLLYRTEFFVPQQRLHPEAGINTKRLLYLNRVLPWGKKYNLCVRPIGHIYDVPQERREPYQRKYYHVLSADEATMDRLLAQTKPRDDFNFFTAFSPTCSYLGVAEGDRLGTAVFLEHVRAFPLEFAEDVQLRSAEAFRAGFLHDRGPSLLLDLPSSERTHVGAGFHYLYQHGDFHRSQTWYAVPIVWLPGTWLFRGVAWTYDALLCYEVLLALLVFGCLTSLVQVVRDRRFDIASTSYLLLTTTLPLYVVYSVMLMAFRQKEMNLVLPMLAVLQAVSITGLWKLFRRPQNPTPTSEVRRPHFRYRRAVRKHAAGVR